MLVLFRLALPRTFPSPASLFNVLKIPAAASAAQPAAVPVDPSVDAVSGPVAGNATAVSWSGGHWLAWLWLSGALVLGSCAVVAQYKFHRRVGRLRPVTDGPTLNLLEDCKALMGVCTPVTLVETVAVKSPTLFGF